MPKETPRRGCTHIVSLVTGGGCGLRVIYVNEGLMCTESGRSVEE
jgi:hypothetical protein